MIEEEDDPKVLAALARGRLRGKRRELAEVVPGLLRDHHRFVLRRHLALIDELSRQVEKAGHADRRGDHRPFRGGARCPGEHPGGRAPDGRTTGSLHEDLGPDHLGRHDKQRRVRYLVAQIEKMGVEVQVQDEAA